MADRQVGGIHSGHRQRMRAKLLAHGPRIFDTYELLEMLLYYVIPYRDTNPTAKELLAMCGSLDGVLSADEQCHTRVSGVGERCSRLLSLVGRLPELLEVGGDGHAPRYLTSSDIVGYLNNYFAVNEGVNIVCMLLDNASRLIRAVPVKGSRFDSGAVRTDSFVSAALGAGASAAVIGYTHRCSVAFPREGDRVTGNAVREELGRVGISLLEIFEVERSGYFPLGSHSPIRLGAGNGSPTLSDAERDALCSFAEGNPYAAYRNAVAESYLTELLAFARADGAENAARTLLSTYGSLATLVSAEHGELCEIQGVTPLSALLVKLSAYLNSRRYTDLAVAGQKYRDMELLAFLSATFLGTSVETVAMLSLDGNGRLRNLGVVGEGTVNHSDVFPRKIAEAAVRGRASSVIIAHNHPRGVASPSPEDLAATRVLYNVLRSSGVRLLAHVVVADGELCVLRPDFDTGEVKYFEMASLTDTELDRGSLLN